MKRYRVWCMCLLAWVIFAGGALADSRYVQLCAQSDINRSYASAWIEIPGAGICQPVMRNAQDDSYYATHDALGEESDLGAVYMQAAYNSADFSDPVTIVYGSSSAEGAPFRDLQEVFSGGFDRCRVLLLHLPDKTVQYEVFAAVPHSSVHILHYYDFTVERRYTGFFDGVFSTRQLGMHLAPEDRPEYGEQVIILSTGLRGDRMQRYLVMARPVRAVQEPPATAAPAAVRSPEATEKPVETPGATAEAEPSQTPGATPEGNS